MSERAKETVLIVEDHAVMRATVGFILESEGYCVIQAGNGREALLELASHSVDLILSDVSMPEMDGLDLLEAVRAKAEWTTIPFLFLTANKVPQARVNGKRLGADDYLVKPVTSTVLVSTVRARLSPAP